MTYSTDHDQILALEKLRVEALVAADVEALAAITAPDYIHVESNGICRTRQEFLDGLQHGDYRFDAFVIDDNKVDLHGEMAIVTGRYHNIIRTHVGLQPVKHAFHMRIYIRRDGVWTNLAHQATTIPADRISAT